MMYGLTTDQGPSLVVDLLDLQWWQALIAIIGILGLSPAPWILGLAMNRIGFTKVMEAAHARELKAKDDTHSAAVAELVKHHDELMALDRARYDEMKASRDGYRDATKEQRQRADHATEIAANAVVAVEASNHLFQSILDVKAEAEEEQ